jgi:hypothetical protein
MWLCLLLPLLVGRPDSGSATGVSFSGALERLGNQSIAIRLADRRVICATLPNTTRLSGKALAARYRMGDQVEIACKAIPRVWEKETARYQYLEVTAIRLMARPSPEDLAKMFEGVPFHEGENLLGIPDSAVGAGNRANEWNGPGWREFSHARRINLEYVANMPNFIADETVKRYKSSAKSAAWTPLDTLETEITFQGDRTIRRQVRRNGKPWDQPFESLPGFKWYGGFGSEIKPVFDPSCPITIEYQGRTQLGGRQAIEYRYSTPVDGCFSFFYQQYQRYNPPRTGRIWTDDPSGNVIQLEEDARDFPTEFELAEREEHLFWDYVKVGEDSHWLPVRATCLAVYFSGTRYRFETEFRNHRHFEAATHVTFH